MKNEKHLSHVEKFISNATIFTRNPNTKTKLPRVIQISNGNINKMGRNTSYIY